MITIDPNIFITLPFYLATIPIFLLLLIILSDGVLRKLLAKFPLCNAGSPIVNGASCRGDSSNNLA